MPWRLDILGFTSCGEGLERGSYIQGNAFTCRIMCTVLNAVGEGLSEGQCEDLRLFTPTEYMLAELLQLQPASGEPSSYS